MKLNELSTEELEKELERRKEEKRLQKPAQKENIDFSKVIELAQEDIDEIFEEHSSPEDIEEYIYEAVMECIYGKDIFN
jgi:hypothetical protein